MQLFTFQTLFSEPQSWNISFLWNWDLWPFYVEVYPRLGLLIISILFELVSLKGQNILGLESLTLLKIFNIWIKMAGFARSAPGIMSEALFPQPQITEM